MNEKKNIFVDCNFSLYPMSDDFVSIILNALEKTDTSKVENFTNALGTTYRGAIENVFKTVQDLFIHAYRKDIHMALEGRVVNTQIGRINELIHSENKVMHQEFPVLCKFSLYQSTNYEKALPYLLEIAKRDDLFFENRKDIFYLEGDVQKVFSFLYQVYLKVGETVSMHFTISVNSPTKE